MTNRPVTDDLQTPDWVRDAIFYQIFPDRFARSVTVPKPRHLDEWGALRRIADTREAT